MSSCNNLRSADGLRNPVVDVKASLFPLGPSYFVSVVVLGEAEASLLSVKRREREKRGVCRETAFSISEEWPISVCGVIE